MLALRPALLIAGFVVSVAFAGVELLAPREHEDAPPACCKTCHKGKACGDSCIARDKECTLPKGCACDEHDEDGPGDDDRDSDDRGSDAREEEPG